MCDAMQAEGTMHALQERSDFLPPEEWEPESNPTLACSLCLCSFCSAAYSVLKCLYRAVQAEGTLQALQERSDFRPPEEWEPESNPTLACSLMRPLLGALGQLAPSVLQEGNAKSYLAEVGIFEQGHACSSATLTSSSAAVSLLWPHLCELLASTPYTLAPCICDSCLPCCSMCMQHSWRVV